jgi:hydroxyacylglutathione hydrolase
MLLLDNGKNVLIETGPRSSVKNLLKRIEDLGLSPWDIDYIILTHIHLDHGGGAGTCLKDMPNTKLLVHPRGLRHLIDPSKLWKGSLAVLKDVARMFGEPGPIPERMVQAAEEEITDIGDFRLKIIFTPSHAPHHLCVYEEKRRISLFR